MAFNSNGFNENKEIKRDSRKIVLNSKSYSEIETYPVEYHGLPYVSVRICGFINADQNIPFPEAEYGDIFIINGSGKIGNCSVKDGNIILCIAKKSPEGSSTEIDKNWIIIPAIRGSLSE